MTGEPVAEEKPVLQLGVTGLLSLRTDTHRLTLEGCDPTEDGLLACIASAPLGEETLALFEHTSDPDEQRTVLTEQADMARSIRDRLVEGVRAWEMGEEGPAMSQEDLELLQQRGYW